MILPVQDPDAEAVNLYVKVGEGESATLFLIGTDSELTPEDGPSTWSISVDPNDPNLVTEHILL